MIPYGKQAISEEDITAVTNCLNSDYLTTGPIVADFESKLASYINVKNVSVCANATCGLHIACLALSLQPGDLVLTSPISFLSSANCAEYCGARVDFIDINEETLCLSADLLRDYCINKQVPKVVIAVSYAGFIGELPKIYELSREFGFYVIEDAAHSIGTTYNYKNQNFKSGSCAHSDIAVFSFHPVKNITTGEGGAVLTNDTAMAEKIALLRTHGMNKNLCIDEPLKGPWYYEMHTLGYNYRITDIQCALGISQLARIEDFKKRRKEIVELYNNSLSANSEIQLSKCAGPFDDVCQHIYPIQLKAGAEVRKLLYLFLKENKVLSQVHYIPIYWQPYYQAKYSYTVGKCPVADRYYSRTLSLPLYSDLRNDQVTYVVDVINRFFAL